MGKLSVILVVLDKKILERAFTALNFNNARLEAVIIDGGNGQMFELGDTQFGMYSFEDIEKFTKQPEQYVWLLNCLTGHIDYIPRMSKFLRAHGVPKDNIVNFVIGAHISQQWLGNIKYIENHPVDYIATGISYTEVGLDLDRISGLRGVNLAGSNQDIRQAYLTAQYVFERQQSIKFVLIGLAPYSFRYDNLESFAVCSRNLQYLFGLNNSRDDSVHGQLLRMLISDQIKNAFTSITEEDADPNYLQIKDAVQRTMSSDVIANWEKDLDNLTKTFRAETFEKNLNYLEQYIQLCRKHGAEPVGIVFPFAPIIRQQYPKDLLLMFRRMLEQLHSAYDFKTIDLFDLPLGYEYFYNLSHMNVHGARLVSIYANCDLYKRGVKSLESMLAMNYNDLFELARVIVDEDHEKFMAELFESTTKKIRRKEKIKIGFVGYDTSMWCGDLLYRLLDQSERYEPTVFMCLRRDKFTEPTIVKDFYHGVEQLQSHGLRVVTVDSDDVEIPRQDVLIFLTPYQSVMPPSFRVTVMTAETLLIYIPYVIQVSNEYHRHYNRVTFIAWKIFWESQRTFALLRDKFKMIRGVYSGHPKLDVFFDGTEFHFNWKEAQPNAVKIIWAPHWSIDSGVQFSTFQWNYQFFYDYARMHPETSWIVKPHPNLLFSAVEAKLFPSAEAFEEYLDRWNELPNAQVITGGYYYDIFQTSDGMILDSGSFIAEYQYTHKPLLFLTRETQQFIPLIDELMKVLYRVNGHDHNGIVKFIEDVLINRNDPMSEARRKFFDANFNYVKDNGMLAGEFIFKAIDRELGGAVNG